MIYSRQATALHSARPGVGIAYCLALLTAAVLAANPLFLLSLLVAVLLIAWQARTARQVLTALRLAVPVALLIALLNPLFSQAGVTVLAHDLWLPLIGRFDVTFESCVYGLVLGLRVVVICACFALYATTVDPDGVLKLFRRLSFRSALTAVLATRMVPLLASDAHRIAEAQRCRGTRSPRLAVFRALTTSALERAVDVSATLELRGYGSNAPSKSQRVTYSRHDRSFALAALTVVIVAVLALSAGSGFAVYPQVSLSFGWLRLLLVALLFCAAVIPFVDRKGIGVRQ